MAKFEDYVNKQGKEEQDEASDGAPDLSALEVADQQLDDGPSGGETEKVDAIPEKYRGKSPEELVRMHQELEQLQGRQGQELGELRSLVNKLIDKNLDSTEDGEDNNPPEFDDAEFFSNPKKVIDDLVNNHPAVKKAEQTTASLTQRQASDEILRRHPDMDAIFQDEGFRAWVKKNPHRQRQLLEANNNFDVDAGDAVLSDWKELQAATKPSTAAPSKTPAKQSVPADTTDADNGNVRGRSRAGGRAKTISRSNIRELQRKDPRAYKEMLPEIRRAYAQGLVVP